MRYVVVLLLLAGCAGCGDLLSPRFRVPPGAVVFTPVDTGAVQYATWWTEMQRCSGISAPMSRITWLYYPGSTIELPGTHFSGMWTRPHAIYLPELHVPEVFPVRHEMLHDLLQRGDHPPEYFQERCGYELAVPFAKPRFP